MSSTHLKPTAITAEALRLLHNTCPFIANIDKQHDKQTTFGGQKRGSTLSIRLPNKYTVRRTWTINTQDVTERKVDLVIGQVFGADMMFEEADLALEINEFSKRFIKPAINVIASSIDSYCLGEAYKAVWSSVGTPGTTPNTAQVYLDGAAKMDNYAVPQEDRVALISPLTNAKTVGSLLSLFNPTKNIAKQYISGQMGEALGYSYYKTQNIPRHTCGSRSGTILINDAGAANATQGSTTISVNGLGGATQTFAAGDVFTVGSVYAVNDETKVSTGELQQFVVTTLATGSGSAVSLTVSPAMYTTGAMQNIDAFPLHGAAVTVVGTASTQYPQNLLYYPEAFTFATANLEMPSDVTFKAQTSVDGINMRILRQFNINNSSYPTRIDVFGGFLAQRPEMACRLWG